MNFVKEFVDSVVIIDDKEEEISGLKESLERQDIWVKHFFPDEIIKNSPIRHRTLLFLDLHLTESNDIKGILSQYTRPILKKHFSNNRAYGIVIWSLHDEEISIFYEKIIEDTVISKIYNAPIFIINLSKSKYTGKNDYSGIIDDLNNEISKSPAASFFMSWSISVTKALTNVVSDFFSLSPDFEDKEKKTIKNLFLLAKNYKGLPKEQLENYPLYQDAYKSFDELIYSSLISQQNDNLVDLFKDYKYPEEPVQKEELQNFAIINEKFHLEKQIVKDQSIIPGSIYEILKTNEYLLVPKRPDSAKTIAIELTPPCDFSGKKLYSKLIGGFIANLPDNRDETIKMAEKFSKAYHYTLWPVLADGKAPQLMCFDFRCLFAIKDSELKNAGNYNPIFRAKHSLFSDILQKYSSHSARLGIACLKP